MRRKPSLEFGITAFEELFMVNEELKTSRLPRIYDIPIDLIDDFPNHPFKVKMDEDMDELVTSIQEQGLITPVILRPKDNGRYEMISGHRRKEACILAGFAMIKAEVREITHEEAVILMVDSNLQRTAILPSEKAFSYKMRLDVLKRHPGRPKANSTPLGSNYGFRSNQQVADEVGDSKTQVQRYIRLTELIPPLLTLVDDNKIALRPAVELSYLSIKEQETVYEQILICDCTPSHAQALRFRKYSKEGLLNDTIIESIMREEKPNQKERLHIPYDQIREFLPRNTSYQQTCDYIIKALKYYQTHHKSA